MSRDTAQSQDQYIEQLTGKSPDDLTGEELLALLEMLGGRLGGENPAQVEDVSKDGHAPAKPDYRDELAGLAILRDHGVITEEEFQAKKKQLNKLEGAQQ